MREFVIQMGHRPGELARVTNALSLYGVNIKSVAAMTFGDQALLHLIPDNVESARSALVENNIPFDENETAVVLLENRAGELTAIAARLAEGGVNLEAAYVVGLTDDLIELAIVSDDVKKAKKLLESSIWSGEPTAVTRDKQRMTRAQATCKAPAVGLVQVPNLPHQTAGSWS